ncbi:MAG TPA: response regulator [Polyangiaceae bacterium]|jgi:CheY-like chemotaxis protein
MGAEDSSESSLSGGAPKAGPPTVLVADDSPVARYMLARRLRAEGFEIVEQETAALPAANVVTQIACALLDVDMGRGEDGRELARQLRAVRADLPVAFFSGSSDPAVLGSAREIGTVFWKPGELEQAVAWVRRQVG